LEYEVFGTRSWQQMTRIVRKVLWGQGWREDLDDAVQVGVLALVEYWLPKYAPTKPTTEDEAKRNWNFAIRFASQRGAEWLGEQSKVQLVTQSLDDSFYYQAEGEHPDLVLEIRDPEPTAEERLCDPIVAVEELISSLHPTERFYCRKHIMSGQSNREVARSTAVSHQTAARHKRQLVCRLRQRAPIFGL